MYVVVFIHRPSSALQMSKISDFERLTLAHPKKRRFLGTQGKAHRRGYSPSPIIILANWDWTGTGILISLWSDGWEERQGLKSQILCTRKLFSKQELGTQWSRLGSQYKLLWLPRVFTCSNFGPREEPIFQFADGQFCFQTQVTPLCLCIT